MPLVGLGSRTMKVGRLHRLALVAAIALVAAGLAGSAASFMGTDAGPAALGLGAGDGGADVASASAQVPPDPPSDGDNYTVVTNERVEMDDGVELSVDVYVPTVDDGAHGDDDGLYPCVVELSPYRKEDRAAEGRSFLPQRGVALIEADARGTGGSEGEYDIVFSVREQHDAANLVDWAAEDLAVDGQPLCEDEVGMFGGSYSGIIQYLTASLPPADAADPDPDLATAPEHLAAIAPQRAYGDLYRDIVYHGGIVIGSFGVIWSQGTTALYLEPPTDAERERGRQAYLDHLTKNDNMVVPYLNNQHADDRWCSDDSPSQYCQDLYIDSSVLPRIENLDVPTLHLAGWWDGFTRGQMLTFQRALDHERAAASAGASAVDRPVGPNYAIVGPWNHGGTHFVDPDQGFQQELADWYQYWLEDRANGAPAPDWIAHGFDGDGDRLKYYQMEEPAVNPDPGTYPENGSWETAGDWPLPGTAVEHLYLREGGQLSRQAPSTSEDPDRYAYTPTAGYAETLSRWDNLAGTPQPRFDQRLETANGLTYRTGPLDEDVEVAGPISLTLYASTTGAPGSEAPAEALPDAAQLTPPYHDTDFVVKLSEVDDSGEATLVTQGYLRASHREVVDDRSVHVDGENLAPFHPHTEASVDPPAVGDVQRYQIEVWPTANTFQEGHQLRLDVMSADTPNHLTLLKPAVNTVYHNDELPSHLKLPVQG